MSAVWPMLVYMLCFLTSAICVILLLRAWCATRSRLLLWTAVSFVFFSLNNLALVADLVIFPHISLWLLRVGAQCIALGILLFGFIWEAIR
jgi:hypothetical protein